ncbi:hypothetical protein, partial [Escherichia coli]|uniref:hypothetical protein n=1 Tax=Escherichia coli TaxID=562 RepID=UPI001BDCEF84
SNPPDSEVQGFPCLPLPSARQAKLRVIIPISPVYRVINPISQVVTPPNDAHRCGGLFFDR